MSEKFNIFEACTWDIIRALGIDEDMTEEEVLDLVFNECREAYDGQVSDVMLIEMCEPIVVDICEELGIDEDCDMC